MLCYAGVEALSSGDWRPSGKRHKQGMTWLIQSEGNSLSGMLEDILSNEFDS